MVLGCTEGRIQQQAAATSVELSSLLNQIGGFLYLEAPHQRKLSHGKFSLHVKIMSITNNWFDDDVFVSGNNDQVLQLLFRSSQSGGTLSRPNFLKTDDRI